MGTPLNLRISIVKTLLGAPIEHGFAEDLFLASGPRMEVGDLNYQIDLKGYKEVI